MPESNHCDKTEWCSQEEGYKQNAVKQEFAPFVDKISFLYRLPPNIEARGKQARFKRKAIQSNVT